tara:strand:- start:242 stop:526 length:285 start_codon:yes stop_codon:yes gene_type:complete
MTKLMRKREKIRAQVKSRFYYLFWGTATLSVVAGQIYLGTSYRTMARSMNRWFEETIDLIQQPINPMPRIPDRGGYYQPMPSSPEDYERYPIIQ